MILVQRGVNFVRSSTVRRRRMSKQLPLVLQVDKMIPLMRKMMILKKRTTMKAMMRKNKRRRKMIR